jgi:5-oxoprolinase (ATP-hydrolysing)
MLAHHLGLKSRDELTSPPPFSLALQNTRITDVELAERRYPVVIHQFAIRRDGPGGEGKFNGGKGVVREFEFTEPLQVSILSERRVHRPSGMHGGLPGAAGSNLWVKKGARLEDGSEMPDKTVNIGGKATVKMAAGDRLLLKTPGGGGWGAPSERVAAEAGKQAFVNSWAPRGSFADHAAKQEGQ